MTSRRHTTVIAGRLAAMGALPVAVTIAMLSAGTAQAAPVHGVEESPVQPGVSTEPQSDPAPDPGLIQATPQPADSPEVAASAPAPAPADNPQPAPAAPAPADNSIVGQVAAVLGGGSVAVGSGALGAVLVSNIGKLNPLLPATMSGVGISGTAYFPNPLTLFGVPLS
ncbi:hypothetical protein [Nocardia stercoris]|uniref:Uncharacterized protein n=1 Tax=Nocardia stercoris TaxID=2483361 RepID=A0A3M2KYB8_9NOCA|nr:hypothetical protein [Nocardia stercoris]RMI30054.1 hypothetical protein EBN03_22735 [Nocardia stercoris]